MAGMETTWETINGKTIPIVFYPPASPREREKSERVARRLTREGVQIKPDRLQARLRKVMRENYNNSFFAVHK